MGIASALRRRLRRAEPWSCDTTRPWREVRFAVIDVETTGLDLRHDEIVSIGVALIERAQLLPAGFYRTIRPARPISVASVKIHSLTARDLDQAPSLPSVLDEVCALTREAVIVAHAAWIERAFLDRALRDRGERLPDDVLDTAALARSLGLCPPGTGEPSLEALSRALGMPVHTPHHALGDATTTAQLLLVLASKIEMHLEQPTVAQLLDRSRPWEAGAGGFVPRW
jgi:DNA polymerase-3 subunit epsilon